MRREFEKMNNSSSDYNKLSKLFEGDLEKAQIILAIKSVMDRLQKTTESISSMSVEDMIPIIDSMKGIFGTEVSKQFNDIISTQFADAISSVREIKEKLNTQVLKLEGKIQDTEVPNNDMFNGDPADTNKSDDSKDSKEESKEESDEVDDFGDLFGGDEAASGPEKEPLGRAKKESVYNSEFPLMEGKKTPTIYNTAFTPKLNSVMQKYYGDSQYWQSEMLTVIAWAEQVLTKKDLVKFSNTVADTIKAKEYSDVSSYFENNELVTKNDIKWVEKTIKNIIDNVATPDNSLTESADDYTMSMEYISRSLDEYMDDSSKFIKPLENWFENNPPTNSYTAGIIKEIGQLIDKMGDTLMNFDITDKNAYMTARSIKVSIKNLLGDYSKHQPKVQKSDVDHFDDYISLIWEELTRIRYDIIITRTTYKYKSKLEKTIFEGQQPITEFVNSDYTSILSKLNSKSPKIAQFAQTIGKWVDDNVLLKSVDGKTSPRHDIQGDLTSIIGKVLRGEDIPDYTYDLLDDHISDGIPDKKNATLFLRNVHKLVGQLDTLTESATDNNSDDDDDNNNNNDESEIVNNNETYLNTLLEHIDEIENSINVERRKAFAPMFADIRKWFDSIYGGITRSQLLVGSTIFKNITDLINCDVTLPDDLFEDEIRVVGGKVEYEVNKFLKLKKDTNVLLRDFVKIIDNMQEVLMDMHNRAK